MAKPHSNPDPGPPPWGLKWRSSTLFIVSTVGIGLFTDLFLYGLVVPILPFILQDRVGLPNQEIQSHVAGLLAAYAGASVLFSPVAGILADRTPSRQLPFLTGLVALLLATILLLVGRSIVVLAVARVLQGVSAAVVWTIGLALTLDTVGPANLGKTIGSIFGFISIGELAAPVLGGVVYEKAGYGGVFGLGFAILAIDFIMRLLLIEKKVAAKYGLKDNNDNDEQNIHDGDDNENPANGQSPNQQQHNETDREDDPLLPKNDDDSEKKQYKIPPAQPRIIRAIPILYCLGDARLLTAQLVALNQAFLLAAYDATVPVVASQYFSFSSLKSGLLFIALVLPYLLLGPVAGWIVDRRGPKLAAVFGFAWMVPFLILLRLVRPGGTEQVTVYCVLLAFAGVGLAAIGAPSIVEAAYVVTKYDESNPGFFGENGPFAQLYGINSMVFSLGLTIGPLVSGGLNDRIGYGNMNIVVAAFCLITSVLSFVYIGGKPRVMRRHDD